ncbi:MAG: CDP-alcohol phosphatidyltransferase family protein [Bacteroidota bacterium]
MQQKGFYIVNAITIYRLLMTPVLVYLIFNGRLQIFAIMLTISFFSDLVDGILARYFKVSSIWGSRLDSIADDLTIVSAMIAMFEFKFFFIKDQLMIFILLFILYVIQNVSALIKYKKLSSFHTYSAKVAALFQGVFLILLFFLEEPPYLLFYLAISLTALDLLEEIILVYMLPQWETDIKGIYWVYRRNRM